MKHVFQSIDRFAVAMARFCIHRHWLIILASLAMTAVSVLGLANVTVSNNTDDFFTEQSDSMLASRAMREKYVPTDNIYILVIPADGGVFTRRTLSLVEQLTNAAWQIPHAGRVDSITNFQHSEGHADELVVEDLVSDAYRLDQDELNRIREIALAEPSLRGFLVDEAARATGINVLLRLPDSLTALPEAVAHVRALTEEYEARYPGIELALVGGAMMSNGFYEAAFTDLKTLFPLMYVVLLLLCFVSIHSISLTFATGIVILFSTISGLGLMGALGYKFDTITAIVPIIILTLAIADSIHILISMRHCTMHEGMDKQQAVEEAIRINFVAVSITSITTMIGFLSLNFSDCPPQRHLGNIAAFGIGAAWLFSTTLLPALVAVLPVKFRGDASSRLADGLMARLADAVIRYRWPALLGLGVVSLFLSSRVLQLEIDEKWSESLDTSIQLRQDQDLMKQYFGIFTYDYSIAAPPGSNVSDPAYLQKLDEFTAWLSAQPDVTNVYSIASIMKRLNRNMHSEDPAFYRVPQQADLSAQYLLLYELSLPYGLDLSDRITIDHSASRVTVMARDMSLMQLLGLFDRTSKWLEDNAPDYMAAEPAGTVVMFTYLTDRILSSMAGGIVLAILLITIVMIVSLWDIRLGLLSVVPNALPILAAFGVWQLVYGILGFSASMVTSISLGIIIDDSVHLLSKYLRARRERQYSPEDSIRYAFRSVGLAILMNTVIIALGFAVLMLSTYQNNAHLGLLMSIIVVMALILDFLLLPALLLIVDRRMRPSATVEKHSRDLRWFG